MTDFKAGDLVQIDPALICGGARKSRGVGTILETGDGGTRCCVVWSDDAEPYVPTRDLVLVSKSKEAA